ncbi:MAG: hypothetical protein HC785_32885 [Calothrix sp. CSU_2_0]|nr:hypothetical protein [Calothrix sp. CSU_2_0]
MEQTINNGIKTDGNSTNTGTKKTRKQRYLPGLPIASSAKDSSKGLIDVLVSRTPTEFSALENYELFPRLMTGPTR